MSDPMFRSFHEPLPVSPPDPRELRRRGERRARRTTIATLAGAVLLVVAVVAPVAALTRGDDKSAPPVLPSPSPTRTVDAAWVRTIPGDFPLGDGIPMPGEASAAMERGKGDPLLPCRNGQSSLGQSTGWVDVATATNVGAVDPSDGTDTRVLALYANESGAQQAKASIAQMYAACTPGAPGVDPQIVKRIGNADAWLLTVSGSHSNAGQLVTVEQVGNALLVQLDYVKVLDIGAADQELAAVRAGQAHVVAAMCVFAAEPCDAPSSKATENPAAGHEIPSSFPLDEAYQDPGSEGEVHPPSPDGDGVVFDPCGVDAFAMPSRDRLAFQVTGPEYADTRELRTYPSADDAVQQMHALRAAVAGCPQDASGGPQNATVWSIEDAATGYDSFAATQIYQQGLGGGVWVFTRVGRSVLALVEGGEFSAESVRVRLPAIVDRAKQIAPSMCLFTEAGC